MVGRVLTAGVDPEPPAGTLVRDDYGTVWVNDGQPLAVGSGDPARLRES